MHDMDALTNTYFHIHILVLLTALSLMDGEDGRDRVSLVKIKFNYQYSIKNEISYLT